MTSYQMLLDSICSDLFKVWQDGCNQESWDEPSAKQMAKQIIKNVESFKLMQQDV
jgi:hypothetical protein